MAFKNLSTRLKEHTKEYFELKKKRPTDVVKRISSLSAATFIYVIFLKAVLFSLLTMGAFNVLVLNSLALGLVIALPLIPSIYIFYLVEDRVEFYDADEEDYGME